MCEDASDIIRWPSAYELVTYRFHSVPPCALSHGFRLRPLRHSAEPARSPPPPSQTQMHHQRTLLLSSSASHDGPRFQDVAVSSSSDPRARLRMQGPGPCGMPVVQLIDSDSDRSRSPPPAIRPALALVREAVQKVHRSVCVFFQHVCVLILPPCLTFYQLRRVYLSLQQNDTLRRKCQ